MQAASGLVVAAVFVLLVLPPLLALFGKRLFWPFIPQTGAKPLTDSGVWHRIADSVARQTGSGRGVSRSPAWRCCAPGLLTTPVGLSQTEQFRVQAESVTGYQTLAAHFPSGLTDPTRVVGQPTAPTSMQRAITGTAGVVSATPTGRRRAACPQWSVVLDAEPASERCVQTIDALRDSVHAVDSERVWSADPTPRPATPAPPPDGTG